MTQNEAHDYVYRSVKRLRQALSLMSVNTTASSLLRHQIVDTARASVFKPYHQMWLDAFAEDPETIAQLMLAFEANVPDINSSPN